LMATLRLQCLSRWVRWCFTIPAPAIVKPVNLSLIHI